MQTLKTVIKKLPLICYALIFALAAYLFFTNDFGLVDIHKTSIVMAVGIDIEQDNNYLLTAQIAVPQPSENGENTSYTEVSGKGATVAEALNEINSKTGFYPKLLHCRLILLGESCKDKNLFQTLDYFYRNEYAQLNALVTMCKGQAKELLSLPTPMANMTTLSLQRILSDELKKSANVSTVNLKELATDHFSPSGACYMPYIEVAPQGSAEGVEQDGKNVQPSKSGSDKGGESSKSSNKSSSNEGGSGSQGSGSSGGSGGSSGSQKSGGGGQATEFTCRKTAVFNQGKFVEILSEEQAFALNLIKNKVRLAIISVDSNGKSYAVGLKNNKSGVDLKFENGVPIFLYKFQSKARVQDVTEQAEPKQLAQNDVMDKALIEATQKAVTSAMQTLTDFCKANNCDLLNAKQHLYKYSNSKFNDFNKNLISTMQVGYEIKIQSAR